MDEFYIENRITRALDATLEMAKSGKYSFSPWIPLAGLTGCGKTSSTKAWLEYNNLKNIVIDAPTITVMEHKVEYFPIEYLQGSGVTIIDEEINRELCTPKSKVVKTIFSNDFMDQIDKETVILIDNYDKATQEQRDELIQLIKYHKVIDLRVDTYDKAKMIDPLMLVVIIDTAQLITEHPLTEAELKLFGLESYT